MPGWLTTGTTCVATKRGLSTSSAIAVCRNSNPPKMRNTNAKRCAFSGVIAQPGSVALGVRQTFGLFIGPFSYDHGLPVTLVALAIALHNLVWGFAQPFAVLPPTATARRRWSRSARSCSPPASRSPAMPHRR
jgi:hypothetical protein